MKRISLLMLVLLFAIGMSSCSIFKKCDCPKFSYLEQELDTVEEDIADCEETLEERNVIVLE